MSSASASTPAPWWEQLSAARASCGDDRASTFAQLATVRASAQGRLRGRPAVRTIAVRSFAENKVRFVTDLRSGKAHDAREHTAAELAWYFAATRIQFRMSGTLALCTGDAAADMWATLHDGQRVWWGWPTPGEDRAPQDQFGELPHEMPPHFAVGVLEPDFVDVLDLSVVPYRREIHECCDRVWTARAVNP